MAVKVEETRVGLGYDCEEEMGKMKSSQHPRILGNWSLKYTSDRRHCSIIYGDQG